jgi:YesN/AraC family two-component response regulator
MTLFRGKDQLLMKPSILIVDDEKVICEGLARYLSEDYTIFKANNGAEAIHIAKNTNLDVILCDIKMPGMDGNDMIRDIRSFNEDIFMMVITAATPDTVCRAMKMGANNFMLKPLDLKQLKISIDNAVNLNNKTDKNIVCH